MWGFAGSITILGMVLMGFAVLVRKLTPEDALLRIVAVIAILAIGPCVAALMGTALPALLKTALYLVAVIVVVTVLVRVVVNLFGR